MTVKDCGHHHDERHKLYRRIALGIAAFLALIGLVAILIWAILKPSKPQFTLEDVTLYTLNTSFSPPITTLSTTMQITISTRNPNNQIGIYYRKLDICASYRGQQVTLPTLLPSTFQGHKDISIWSPYLYGNQVPVRPDLAAGLSQDYNFGSVLFNIKVNGYVKWKVGSWISGKYHLNVNCPAFIRFAGSTVGPAMKFQIVQRCHVEV